jgi:hypothetical protein
VTGVLSRLIDHALDPGGTLQPRTLGRFEPARGRPDVIASEASPDAAGTAAAVTDVVPTADVPEGPPGVTPITRSAPLDRGSARRAAPVRAPTRHELIEGESAPVGIAVRRPAEAPPPSPTRSRGTPPPPESPALDREAGHVEGPLLRAPRNHEQRIAVRETTPTRRAADVLPGSVVEALHPAEPAGAALAAERPQVPRRAVSLPSIELAPRSLAAAELPPPTEGPAASASPAAMAAMVAPETLHAPVSLPSARRERVPPPGLSIPSPVEGVPSEPVAAPPRIAVAAVRHQPSGVAATGPILDDDRWGPAASTRAGPVVRVSIGRIEVRAVSAPVSPPRTAATRRSAGPSLEDYLRARNGSGR